MTAALHGAIGGRWHEHLRRLRRDRRGISGAASGDAGLVPDAEAVLGEVIDAAGYEIPEVPELAPAAVEAVPDAADTAADELET